MKILEEIYPPPPGLAPLLTRKKVIIVVSLLILSKLDYCYSLYDDISCSRTKKIAICAKLRSETDLQQEKI